MNRSIGLRRGSHRHPTSSWTDGRIAYLRTAIVPGRVGARHRRGIRLQHQSQRRARKDAPAWNRQAVSSLSLQRKRRSAGKTIPAGCRIQHKASPRAYGRAPDCSGLDRRRQAPRRQFAARFGHSPFATSFVSRIERRSCRWPVGDPGTARILLLRRPSRCRASHIARAHCARAYRPAAQVTQRAPSARMRRAMLKYRGVGHVHQTWRRNRR